jgi:hypothetical protein
MFEFATTMAGPILVIETSAAVLAGLTMMLQLAPAEVGAVSVTLALKLKVFATVGVPVIAPVERFRPKDVGSEPEAIENA